MSQKTRIILLTSLLFNLLLAGIVLGHFSQRMKPFDQSNSQEVVNALPSETRLLFNDALAKAKQDGAPLMAEIDGTRRAALCLLTHEQFDRKAYLATTEKLHALFGKFIKQQTIAIADISPKLSPEARIAFVDLLKPPHPPRNLAKMAKECSDTKEQ